MNGTMSEAFKYLAALSLCALTSLSACSNDSGDEPSGAAGSAGKGRGGSAGAAGTAGEGGTQASGGTNNGGRAGAAGSASGGSGAGASGEAGAGQGGADDGGDVIATCLAAPVIPDTETQALRLTGEGLELGIVRYVPSGSLNDLQFTLQRFALVRAGVGECVSDPARLKYAASHHNWDDKMTANAQNETWVVAASSAAGVDWTVEGRAGGALAWGPIALTIASCERKDSPGLECDKTPIE
jgi:hypothetical protein